MSVTDTSLSATYYYMADANKNIGQLVGSEGNIVAKYEYSPFGQIVSQSGDYAETNPFRFSSEYYDEETGLVYYNYRYYNSILGMWLSRDPIEEIGGLNLYGFTSNNPVNGWDRLGLVDLDDAKGVVEDFGKNKVEEIHPGKEFKKLNEEAAITGWDYLLFWRALHKLVRRATDAISPREPKPCPNAYDESDEDKFAEEILRDLDSVDDTDSDDTNTSDEELDDDTRALMGLPEKSQKSAGDNYWVFLLILFILIINIYLFVKKAGDPNADLQ